MKNSVKRAISALLVSTALIATITSCGTNTDSNSNSNNTSSEKETTIDPLKEQVYYGCPTSKKVKRLNIIKRRLPV